MRRYFVTSPLLSSASIFALLLSTGALQASGLPNGGHFLSGKGEIGKAGQSLTVKQSSTTGIIDWNRFSIGTGNTVTFDNGSGATLNRVTGGNLSRIAGSLRATGTLYLLNSSGVIVSGTGKVVTGGSFVASSGGMTNSAFDADQRRLSAAQARVVNRGGITAGGEAKLIGSSATNAGTITASVVKLRAEGGEALDTGTIRATGGANRDADILVVSQTGETKIAGKLIAANRDGSGGQIETSGHSVSLAGTIDAGKGGTWLVDPENLTINKIAASEIDKALDAGTNVLLATTAATTSGAGKISSGVGDIVVASALSWNTSAKLTLDTYAGLVVRAPITIERKGVLKIDTGSNESGANLVFSASGHIVFDDLSSSLKINEKDYTLVGDLRTLEADISGQPSKDFALANDYDAAADGTYSRSPIYSVFAGVFEGLGNTISDFTIDNTQQWGLIGLFAVSTGTIRDLALANENITDPDGFLTAGLTAENLGVVANVDVQMKGGIFTNSVGGLAGLNMGEILGSSASVDLRGDAQFLGGLAGQNWGEISESSSSGTIHQHLGGSTVSENPNIGVGGLVGLFAKGEIKNSSSSTSVVAAQIGGGLVGWTDWDTLITGSSASGHVIGWDADDSAIIGNYYLGGLVGRADGRIVHSSATGNITHRQAASSSIGQDGGLVGYLDYGAIIKDSYAKGSVDGHGGQWIGGLVGLSFGEISESFATGRVYWIKDDEGYSIMVIAGGLVGLNDGSISNSYATGSVSGAAAGSLAGTSGGKIHDSYGLGFVTTVTGKSEGGFTGDFYHPNSATDCYWDLDTTGISDPSKGDAAQADYPGIIGVTTAQLKSDLQQGFDSSIWAIDSSINNGFPYLIAIKGYY